MKTKSKIVIFGHHPCPDGLGAMVCLEKMFGSNAVYCGLNHGKIEDMRKTLFSALSPAEQTHIMFVDIAPSFLLLKEILNNPIYTVTILDHHPVDKLYFENNQLDIFTKSKPPRLHLELDHHRSGVGIAYNYVNGRIKPPISVLLTQAIDLFTATSNPKIINDFCKEITITKEIDSLIIPLILQVDNNEIKRNIIFYALALIFDLKTKAILKQSNGEVDYELILAMKNYFCSIDQHGVQQVLSESLPNERGELSTLEESFITQLKYQNNALDKAKIIPSLIDENLDVLLIDANMQSGRTFDPLIAQKLSKLARPTIAMVINTKNISSMNWVSLRAGNDQYNLYDIAQKYLAKKLVENAGGHPRAAALQFNREQILMFLDNDTNAKLKSQGSFHGFFSSSLTQSDKQKLGIDSEIQPKSL